MILTTSAKRKVFLNNKLPDIERNISVAQTLDVLQMSEGRYSREGPLYLLHQKLDQDIERTMLPIKKPREPCLPHGPISDARLLAFLGVEEGLVQDYHKRTKPSQYRARSRGTQ